MKKNLMSVVLIFISQVCFSQITGSITGKITDKFNEPLPGATISIKGTSTSVSADNLGNFILEKVLPGKLTLLVSHIGYETLELEITVTDKQAVVANASLALDEKIGNAVVVSASRRPEKITNAPASIQVIGLKDLKQLAGSNVYELLSKIQGIEYTRNGVDDITFNARGFHSAFNNKVFQLVDGRNSMAALSGSLPVLNRGTTIKDDIERLEIVLGPQSALYGPNAHNAVINTITKDPRKYPGTTVSLSAGSRSQFSGRLRQAYVINNKWAYKFTGEYAVGKEFTFYDSVYAGGNAGPVVNGYGPPVAIPERNVDFDFRHIRGEGHLYYSVTPKADIIISGGGSNNNWPQVTATGRNQMRGVTYSFIQARFVHPRYFVTIYNTWGSLGTSYLIPNYTRDFWNRTHSTITNPNSPLYKNFGKLSPDSSEMYALRLGNMFKEKSQRINAETQYNYTFKKAGLFLVAGLNYQKEKPNGFGINLVDKEKRIYVTQYGAVLQLEKSLPGSLRFITAARLDHHSNFGTFVSPKFALVKGVGDGNYRITWGRAYAMPSILNQYAGINSFLFGNGAGIKYIPNGSKFSDPLSVKTTTALKPEQVSTLELGYKGTIAKKLYIDINYYNGLSKNFLSPAQSVGGRALFVGQIPVTQNPVFAGTLVNDTLKNASFVTFFNYGDVRAYGLDLGLDYAFNKFVNLALKYSWFGSNITKDNIKNDANKDGYVSLEEKSLNAPKNRGAAILSFQNLCKQKLFLNVAARYVQQYDFYSGSQIGTAAGKGSRGKIERPGQPPLLKNFDHGPLGGFTTIDLSTGYKLNSMTSLNLGVTNLFDTRQVEFVGAPSIGRLIMAEVKVDIPSTRKKK